LFGGEISRTDVAQMCIAALLKKGLGKTTVEIMNKKGYATSIKNVPDDTLKLLLHDEFDSYDGLLDGLFTDEDMSKFDVVNDYRGTKVESLAKLI